MITAEQLTAIRARHNERDEGLNWDPWTVPDHLTGDLT